MASFSRFFLLLAMLTLGLSKRVQASDGFDNNYVGGDANQFAVTINGQNRVVLFGPGQMSTGSFFIGVPNGVVNNQGQVSTFVITGVTSFLRSAYLDRVVRTAFYYRIYPASSVPPGWDTLNLQSQNMLLSGTCYGQTQINTWQINQPINVVQGLSNGNYVLEFYTRSELYDVGIETDTCNIDANQQCNAVQVHPGRYISSRFNTTDPAVCNLYTTVATQSNPSKILFEVINSPLPVELTYFQATAEDKGVRLRWGVAQEQGLQDFMIERSSDGYSWLGIGTLAAATDPAAAHDYFFLDQQPWQGPNYYRLYARSSDGHADISPVIEVTMAGRQDQLSVWPNPARDVLYYTMAEKADQSWTLRLVDTQGRVRATQSDVPSEDSSLPINDLEEGVYFLEMADLAGRRIAATRVVKMR